MARICGSFLRVTQHNRAVFGEYYFDMVEYALKQKLVAAATSDDRRSQDGTSSSAADSRPSSDAAKDASGGATSASNSDSEWKYAGKDDANTSGDDDTRHDKEKSVRWDSLDLD